MRTREDLSTHAPAWGGGPARPGAMLLLALAVGDLEYAAIGPRTGVYAEPSVLEAARWAPSGFNLQPTQFVVVVDADLKKSLRSACMNQIQMHHRSKSRLRWRWPTLLHPDRVPEWSQMRTSDYECRA